MVKYSKVRLFRILFPIDSFAVTLNNVASVRLVLFILGLLVNNSRQTNREKIVDFVKILLKATRMINYLLP